MSNTRRKPHVAGLILARGGSQGIPLKNLAPLGGRPLLEWALGAMLNFGQFDSIWVSTDHPGIATCASALGVQVFARSAKFASSEAASVDAVNEFLLNHQDVDIVALVQCTSPFLRPEFLAEAYRLMVDEQYDSVFSVYRQKKFRWSEMSKSKQFTQPLNFNPSDRPRRQQEWAASSTSSSPQRHCASSDLVENGMFYFTKRSLVTDQRLLQGGQKCSYIEIDSKLSLEIDSSLDLSLAEQVILHEGFKAYGQENDNTIDSEVPMTIIPLDHHHQHTSSFDL